MVDAPRAFLVFFFGGGRFNDFSKNIYSINKHQQKNGGAPLLGLAKSMYYSGLSRQVI